MGNHAGSHLRPEVVTDLENTTAFSADEIREFYRSFIKDCASSRMSLSVEEFKAAYTEIFPKGDATRFAENVFRNFDKDGGGRIDFKEFISALSVQLKGSLEEKLEWLFQLYDIDNTDFVEKCELLEMFRSMQVMRARALPAEDRISPEMLADYIMHRADKDKDGRLSKSEFIKGAMASKTIQRVLLGTLEASSSPFLKRKAMNVK